MCNWVPCLRQWVEMLSWFLFTSIFEHVFWPVLPDHACTRSSLSKACLVSAGGEHVYFWQMASLMSDFRPSPSAALLPATSLTSSSILLLLFPPCFSRPCVAREREHACVLVSNVTVGQATLVVFAFPTWRLLLTLTFHLFHSHPS